MNKAPGIIAASFLKTAFPMQLNTSTDTKIIAIKEIVAIESAKTDALLTRLDEIYTMNKGQMTLESMTKIEVPFRTGNGF